MGDNHNEQLLCRYESNLSAIHLQRSHTVPVVNGWVFEEALEEHVVSEEEAKAFGRPPVFFPARPDMVWLSCQRQLASSPSSSIQQNSNGSEEEIVDSITGLLEEADGAPQDLNIKVIVWNSALIMGQQTSSSLSSNHGKNSNQTTTTTTTCCPCGEVKNPDWIRKSLQYEPPQQQQQQQQQHSRTSTNNLQRTIQWVDLRAITTPLNNTTTAASSSSLSSSWLPTKASVTHFLRCLLESDHSVSPWVSGQDHKSNNNGNNHHDCSHHDCVVVLLHGHAPETLVQFRVSDVCPSWYLHTTVLLKLPTTPTPTTTTSGRVWYPWDGTINESSTEQYANTTTLAELLVYRKLPPRQCLSSLHPITKEPVPIPGCLWETVITYPPQQYEDDGEKKNNDHHHHQQQQQLLAAAATTEPIITYRITAPPYIDYESEYIRNNTTNLIPNVAGLFQPENMRRIQQEAANIPQWTAWPEQQHYASSNNNNNDGTVPWNVFPLCYCFPAHDITQRKWIPATANFVPHTVQLLQQYVGDTLRTALFSKLTANSVLDAHTGWDDLANYVYRCHIPIDIPDGNLCGLWVDGCVQIITNTATSSSSSSSMMTIFDDSKTHRAFNYSPHDRIVLILDLARPSHLPIGTAVGGHSNELDEFISQYGGVSNI